jgi:nitrilase
MKKLNQMPVAAIQMVSSDQLAENLKVVEKLVMETVTRGAKLLVLPESFALMASNAKR